jgi:CRISPR/Cas system-associated endonuclease Cas1
VSDNGAHSIFKWGMRHRPRVIILGSNAALRIRNGALDLEHGPAADRVKLKIDIDEPKPCAILFDGRVEFITGEAIRFCARYAIDIILPNGPGRAILFTESALEAADGGTLRDVGPAIIRAQCAADPVQVAREIVLAKIVADAEGFGPRLTERDFSTIARCEAKLATARSVAEIIVIEAKAASVYWRSHRDLGLTCH